MCTRVSEYLNQFSLLEKDVEDAEKGGKNWKDYLKEVSVFASGGLCSYYRCSAEISQFRGNVF